MVDRYKVIPLVPKETARAAKSIFGCRNFYIQIGEHLETILEDIQMDRSLRSETALSLVTFFQFLEGLTDTQAIDAVRTRIDWKFALHLPVYPPTFHESMLCEFRQKVLSDALYKQEFQNLINQLAKFNPPANSQYQNTSALEMISLVCSVNQLNMTYEALCRTLEVLAYKFPNWLLQIALPSWYGRYNRSISAPSAFSSFGHQEPSLDEIEADIQYLLNVVYLAASDEMNELEEVKALHCIWKEYVKNMTQLILSAKWGGVTWNQCDFCINTSNGKFGKEGPDYSERLSRSRENSRDSKFLSTFKNQGLRIA